MTPPSPARPPVLPASPVGVLARSAAVAFALLVGLILVVEQALPHQRYDHVTAYLIGAALICLALPLFVWWDLRRHGVGTRALEAQGRLLGVLADGIDQGVVVIDTRGRVVWRNQEHRRIHGDLTEALPDRWADLIGLFEPDGTTRRAAEAMPLMRALTGEAVADDRVLIRNARVPGGRQLRISAVPLCDVRGRIVGALALFADITEELRTAAQLRQVQKLDTIGQLTAGVAHNFNNLLTVVQGGVETILQDQREVSPRLRTQLDLIAEAAGRGAEITHRLRAFSRQQLLEPEPCELGSRLRDLISLIEAAMTAAVEVRLDAAEQPLWVRADCSGLDDAVVQLALNARDAMPDGGVLTLRTRRYPQADVATAVEEALPDGPVVAIEVEDTGPGVPPERREAVFEPFYTSKGTVSGSGLGLAMVHGFVHQSGGAVLLEEGGQGGALFRLLLPEAPADA